MTYNVRIRSPYTSDEVVISAVDHVNFVNPETHGDHKILLGRDSDDPYIGGAEAVFINTAAVLSVRVKEE